MTRLLPNAVGGAALAAALLLSSCAPEIVEEEFSPSDSHADYVDAIERLDLGETAIGSRWIEAGRRAVSAPVQVETPFQEVVYFDPAEPGAVSYRFQATRGHAVSIQIESTVDRYFADVFRSVAEEDPTLVASRPEGDGSEADDSEAGGSIDRDTVMFEPRRDGEYILRIQPELLRGGRVSVRVVADASLSFPVDGAGPGDIWSYFGDPRDGGARIHEGIDIFAPRGTPLLAASDSYVLRVGRRDRGGNVVVLHDRERDLLLYYAHLDEHRAVQGSVVEAGDIVGTTGNTGNAATTPPHLHIGIYDGSWRQALDPWNFFVGPNTEPYPIALDPEVVGAWRGVAADTSLLFAAEGPNDTTVRYVNRNPFLSGAGDSLSQSDFAGEVAESRPVEPSETRRPIQLAAGTAVRVLGGFGPYARVRDPAGNEGFITAEALGESGGTVRLPAGTELSHPGTGDIVASLTEDSVVGVVGEHRLGTIVVLPDGRALAVEDSAG